MTTKKVNTSSLMHGLTGASHVMGRKTNVSVEFKGEQACTDGNTITLPQLPESEMITQHEADVIRGFADHESGHIRHTNMDTGKKFLNTASPFTAGLYQVLEDTRLEDKVSKEYSGARKNLNALNTQISEDMFEQVQKATPEQLSDIPTMAQFGIVSEANRVNAIPKAEESLAVLPEELQKNLEGWVKASKDCKTSTAVERLAKHITEIFGQDPNLTQEPEEIPDMNREGDQEKGEGQEGEGQEGEGQEGEVQEGEVQEGEGQEGEGQEGEVQEGEGQAKGGKGASNITIDENNLFTTSREEAISNLKLEYGDGKQNVIYTSRDVKHVQAGTRGGTIGQYDKVKRKVNPVINVLRNKLLRYLKSLENRDWDSGRIEGRLDVRRLVSAYTGERNVYRQRAECAEPDTAISILVDLSGSMDSRIHAARNCAVSLCEALEVTPFAYNITGFTTGDDIRDKGEGVWATERLVSVTFKDWNKKLYESRTALADMVHFVGNNNNDSASIQLAADDLASRPEKRKILFVLSDGSPAYDLSSYPTKIDEHLKKTVKQVEDSGIEVVGIGIETDCVKNFYTDNFVVNNPSDLAGRALDKIFSLTTNR